ncbi:MAG: substrate-binding domain-containing protein [Clostridiales bacterium]|nr:substrate-binding domain-containing protein [Clostridiales bacterium]
MGPDHTTNAKEKIDFLLDYQVDGIIMQPIDVKSSDFTRIRKEKVPLVFVDIEDEENYCDSVVIDNESITYEVIKHLVDNGHKNIALITGGSGIVTTDDRVAGYIRALQEGGMPFRPEYVFKESVNEQSGYSGMKSFMSLETPPTAVFAAGHDLMSGSLTYVADNNLSIPDDISFVGFENLEVAKIYNPRLTVGIQPMEKIARVASDMLYERMTGSYLGVARKRKVDTIIEYGASVKKID